MSTDLTKLTDRTEDGTPCPPRPLMDRAGFHWLKPVDYDKREGTTLVLQWNPGERKWSYPGDVGTGHYVDARNWNYHSPCVQPHDDDRGSIPAPYQFMLHRYMNLRQTLGTHIAAQQAVHIADIDRLVYELKNDHLASELLNQMAVLAYAFDKVVHELPYLLNDTQWSRKPWQLGRLNDNNGDRYEQRFYNDLYVSFDLGPRHDYVLITSRIFSLKNGEKIKIMEQILSFPLY